MIFLIAGLCLLVVIICVSNLNSRSNFDKITREYKEKVKEDREQEIAHWNSILQVKRANHK